MTVIKSRIPDARTRFEVPGLPPTIKQVAEGQRVREVAGRYLSPAGKTAPDVVTDASTVGRTLVDLVSIVHPSVVVGSALDGTIGMSTGINAFLGADGYRTAMKTAAVAKKLGFTEGERKAKITAAARITQCVGGTLYFGIRGLSLNAYLKGIDTSSISAPTLVGRVTYVLSAVGSALWGAFYSLLAVVCALDIHHAAQFRRELMSSCVIDDDNEYDIEQLKRYMEFMHKWGSNTNIAERRKMKLSGLTSSQSAEAVQNIDQAEVEKIFEGLLSIEPRVQETAITRAQTLIEKNKELITRMIGELDTNWKLNVGYLTACVFGIAATVIGFVALGPVGVLIATVGFLICSIMMIALDGYSLNEALKNVEPGKFDKTMLTISTIIGLLSFAGSLIVIGTLSLGIVPLIAGIVIALVWMGVNARTWYAVSQAEKKFANAPETVVSSPVTEDINCLLETRKAQSIAEIALRDDELGDRARELIEQRLEHA